MIYPHPQLGPPALIAALARDSKPGIAWAGNCLSSESRVRPKNHTASADRGGGRGGHRQAAPRPDDDWHRNRVCDVSRMAATKSARFSVSRPVLLVLAFR